MPKNQILFIYLSKMTMRTDIDDCVTIAECQLQPLAHQWTAGQIGFSIQSPFQNVRQLNRTMLKT